MAKYLFKANYLSDGVKGLMADGGTKRQGAAAAAIESVGGTLDCFYYAFGETDALGIADFPDAASATALSMLINASGSVTISLTPLLTPAEVDEAAAKNPSYNPPGT
jgi:uncharacterized protein with GYD domain